MSLSQLNTVSTLFLTGKFFIKSFLHQTQGCFLQYPCYPHSGAKSKRPLLPFPPVSSGLPRALFDSTVNILCCVLENMGVGGWSSRWLEFKVAVLFPYKLLVPVWGRWLETGFCWISGSDFLARRGKTHDNLPFLTHTSHWPEVLVESSLKSQIVLFGLCKSLPNLFVKHGNNGLPLSDMKTLQVQYFQRKKPLNPKKNKYEFVFLKNVK